MHEEFGSRALIRSPSRDLSLAARFSDAVAHDVVGATTAVVIVDGSSTAVADDVVGAETAVVVVDGSATAAAAARGSNRAAAGPIHVTGCMCTGRP